MITVSIREEEDRGVLEEAGRRKRPAVGRTGMGIQNLIDRSCGPLSGSGTSGVRQDPQLPSAPKKLIVTSGANCPRRTQSSDSSKLLMIRRAR